MHRLRAHVAVVVLDAMQRFEIGPASVSVLVLGAWGAKVESLNERAFLKDIPKDMA